MFKNTKIKKRDSNFELLRILAMLAVILSHFNLHGNFNNVDIYNFNINYLITRIFTVGCFANCIFILITGFFMIKSNVNYKKIISLIIDMVFYSCIIYLILILCGKVTFNKADLIKVLLPVFYGNWYCIYYVIFYLFIPIMNYVINSISKEKVQKLIFLIFMLFSVITTFTNNIYLFSNFTVFVLLYFIGAYIRLYMNQRLNIKNIIICIILSLMITLSTVVLQYILGVHLHISKMVTSSHHFIVCNFSFFVIVPAIFIFLLFKDLNIKYNKYINYISASVLPIYLIHENFLLKNIIWNEIFPNKMFINQFYFIFFAILKVLIVFVTCLMIDKLKKLLFENMQEKLCDKLYLIFEKVYLFIYNFCIRLLKKLYN